MPSKRKIKPKLRAVKKARAKKKLKAKTKQGNTKKKQKAVKRRKALGKGVKTVMNEQTEMNLERADETQIDPGLMPQTAPIPLSQEEMEEVDEQEPARDDERPNGEADEDDFE